ncbi:hypothetical protein [Nonomuraea soli]|uniref:Integrase SAM-like N-terminal domain-containing protein n=1 Tax=Nonomuraea soli TaxID=1032476 RepID=A0A7W0CSH7_9ACTN|nr:hypothetical protein [Nonomuraea soli]MBA2896412.1 hypothetical protein [Nonomuraea soli]
MINHEHEGGIAFFARCPAVRTVAAFWRYARAFTDWLVLRGITRFGQGTAGDLDEYASHVKNAPISHSMREDMPAAVIRTWTMRYLMPEHDRLPPAPPWGGERVGDVLERRRVFEENKTPRIHPAP